MSKKRRIWRLLQCLVILSLLALTTSGCGVHGKCEIEKWEKEIYWKDTWGEHWVYEKYSRKSCSGGAEFPYKKAQGDAAAGQPQPVVAMQVPEEYLGVPYPWIVVVKPEVGTEQTFVISPIPIYDPSIVNELEARWPSPPGSWWRVFGVDLSDVARIEEAVPPSGPFEVWAEAIFSFHAAAIERTMVIAEYDHITHEWVPPYVYAPELPVVFAPRWDREVSPNTKPTFTHTLTNTATIERTFDLTYDSALGWDYVISLAQAPGIPVTDTGPVAPGEAVDILVSTWVPPEEAGSVETVVVTATAQDDPAVTQSVVNRIYVWHVSFLPMIRNGIA